MFYFENSQDDLGKRNQNGNKTGNKIFTVS